jgi:hypothetical protein
MSIPIFINTYKIIYKHMNNLCVLPVFLFIMRMKNVCVHFYLYHKYTVTSLVTLKDQNVS